MNIGGFGVCSRSGSGCSLIRTSCTNRIKCRSGIGVNPHRNRSSLDPFEPKRCFCIPIGDRMVPSDVSPDNLVRQSAPRIKRFLQIRQKPETDPERKLEVTRRHWISDTSPYLQYPHRLPPLVPPWSGGVSAHLENSANRTLHSPPISQTFTAPKKISGTPW